jgi:hypothetical protein
MAALISRKYLQYGLSARAFGPNIIYNGNTALGGVTVTSGPSITTDISSAAATAAAAACYALPHLPCLGLFPDYDTPRLYTQEGITETPRQHIIRRHILGTATLGPPPITVYANPLELLQTNCLASCRDTIFRPSYGASQAREAA